MFAAGERPRARDVERALAVDRGKAGAGVVSHRPRGQEGWVELLASGLTFDLLGLAPGPGEPVVAPRHVFGQGERIAPEGLEAVTLAPGPHLAGGARMIPVVRVLVGLVAGLSLGLKARAVCWGPAATWMEPAYFARIVRDWLAGGPFPALGLTAVEVNAVGGISSVGLSFFTGQELLLEGRPGEARVDAVRLAVRLIDFLAQQGRLSAPVEIAGTDGEPLLAEPSANGRQVIVWRT